MVVICSRLRVAWIVPLMMVGLTGCWTTSVRTSYELTGNGRGLCIGKTHDHNGVCESGTLLTRKQINPSNRSQN